MITILVTLVSLLLVLSVVLPEATDSLGSGPVGSTGSSTRSRHSTTATTTAPTTATTVAATVGAAVAAPSTTSPAPVASPTTLALPPTTVAPPPPPPPPPPAVTTGCGEALAYLAAHQAPGFADTCADGSALGHYGFTCADVPGMCPDVRIIHIACPAPFVYMNEAHNSWVVIGQASGIDPYGQGTGAERAFCDAHR
ncbi:MAG: hypothetical protein ACXVJ7_09120 [Acidimicrobiia bacterium]